MKLFEIPVYAFSRDKLANKVKIREEEFHYYPYGHIDDANALIPVSDTFPKK